MTFKRGVMKKTIFVKIFGIVLVFILLFITNGLGEEMHSASVFINANKPYNISENDITRLKGLLGANWDSGGWTADPKQREKLKAVQIPYVRLINELCPGRATFEVVNEKPKYTWGWLDQRIPEIKSIGAEPYLILGTPFPKEFLDKLDISKEIKTTEGIFTDPNKTELQPDPFVSPKFNKLFEDYLFELFKHVNVDLKADITYFEVGNEYDSCNCWFVGAPDEVKYQKYLDLYRICSKAVERYTKSFPEAHKIKLGGPSGCASFASMDEFWAAKTNWYDLFLRDCQREGLKLDFITYHFYGDPEGGINDCGIIPFREIITFLKSKIKAYLPECELIISEWGPHFQTDLSSARGKCNATNVGAARIAKLLYVMMTGGVDKALLITINDYSLKGIGLKPSERSGPASQTCWNFASLFTEDGYTKTPYNLFKMVSMLAPQRIIATTNERQVGIMASKGDGKVTIMLWNHDWLDGDQNSMGKTLTLDREINIRLDNPPFKGKLRYERYSISEDMSNSYDLFFTESPFDGEEELQKVEEKEITCEGNCLNLKFTLSKESTTLIILRKEE